MNRACGKKTQVSPRPIWRNAGSSTSASPEPSARSTSFILGGSCGDRAPNNGAPPNSSGKSKNSLSSVYRSKGAAIGTAKARANRVNSLSVISRSPDSIRFPTPNAALNHARTRILVAIGSPPFQFTNLNTTPLRLVSSGSRNRYRVENLAPVQPAYFAS